MLDGNVSTVGGCNPTAFEFGGAVHAEEDAKLNEVWSELEVKSTVLKLHEPGVTVKEEGVRVIVCKDCEEQVWLKAPAAARQLPAYKRNKERRLQLYLSCSFMTRHHL